MLRFLFFGILFQIQIFQLSGQGSIKGIITDESNASVSGATINVKGSPEGAISKPDGTFSLNIFTLPVTLKIDHISFKSREIEVNDTSFIVVTLIQKTRNLDPVEIRDDKMINQDLIQNEQFIGISAAKGLPSAFGDFNKVLTTLPGVSGNNELSSAYAVRGGNFDENLVYVNDIPIYRPFLANSGRQEGLSFVNPDMVQNISFFAGGWESKYGDKLSSNLLIDYKEPSSFEGSISFGMLGGSAYLGGTNDSERINYLVGARYRNSKYLLNTLEVNGEYFPVYTDFQSLLTFDLTKKNDIYKNRTKLNWLLSYGRNRYLTEPTSQVTEFGSVLRNFRIQTAFEGREIMDYDTYQSGIKLSHTFSQLFKTEAILSGVYTREKEFFDVEGGYRLCDIDNNLNNNQFDKCILIRGIGSNYNYGRNKLDALLSTIESRNEWLINLNNVIEFGAGITYQYMQDDLNEYSFIDSAGYSSITSSIFNDLNLSNQQIYGYLQYSHFSNDSIHLINIGSRINYWSENGQLLISPRVQYQIRPLWKIPTRFNLSVGVYQQHPFYRELRDRNGNVDLSVRAQQSIQIITGMDQFLTWWGRPFIFTSQAYYKYLWNLNPYEIDNLRIRYFADNNSTGYATGLDFRLNGEFIQGTQSWFSVGYLQTKEQINGIERGFIRRPGDQRLNIGIYFEDHIPYDPTLRVYLNLVLASGFPFGPPGSDNLRNRFQGDEYYRADIGFSKSIKLKSSKYIENLWIRLEILNAFAADNTISYTWIEDVNGTSFAIPNSLSARYFNLKTSIDF